jgi:hypothetical protein
MIIKTEIYGRYGMFQNTSTEDKTMKRIYYQMEKVLVSVNISSLPDL